MLVEKYIRSKANSVVFRVSTIPENWKILIEKMTFDIVESRVLSRGHHESHGRCYLVIGQPQVHQARKGCAIRSSLLRGIIA